MIDTDALISYLVVDKVIKDGEKRGANLSKNDKNISRYLPLISPKAASISAYLTVDKVQKKTQTSLENGNKWEAFKKELTQLQLSSFDEKKIPELSGEELKELIKEIEDWSPTTSELKDAKKILVVILKHYL
ncbi:MAG: hypothetical protein AAGG68_28450 [Bacteroidota bacterium]